MAKTVAILQSNYIPWKGYFDIINAVDEFILYDDCQFTKNDWRNRNKIRVPQGTMWLTIPVRTSGRLGQPICRTEVLEARWAHKHWQSILTYYAKAPFFPALGPVLQRCYETAAGLTLLSRINHLFMQTVCEILGMSTVITWSMDYRLSAADPSGKVLELCRQAGASAYLTGPSACAYLDEAAFAAAGIETRWMDYAGYAHRPYRQVFEPCIHEVSIIDLLLNSGPEQSRELMLTFESPPDRSPGEIRFAE
jgi:hypothetical protein